MPSTPLRHASVEIFKHAQKKYCDILEKLDGAAHFLSEEWQRPDHASGNGGGGTTKILRKGGVFEQAGVNFSEVYGTLSAEMTERLTGEKVSAPFYATGISLVIHPNSPLIPTTHANLRYLEVGSHVWFGGGADLTPYYLFDEDAVSFHQTLKEVSDRHDPAYYPKFKKWCDEYFYLPHRKETRGIGGLFFDYLGKDSAEDLQKIFSYVKDFADALPSIYVPIVERRKSLPFTESQKAFQLIRRGRYVEFNLLYDRGTIFGLKTDGRVESILMSLPPEVRWEYNFTPPEGSPEEALLKVLQSPRDWL